MTDITWDKVEPELRRAGMDTSKVSEEFKTELIEQLEADELIGEEDDDAWGDWVGEVLREKPELMSPAYARFKAAREIYANWDSNDWYGSAEIEECVDNRYAIVIEREDDSWVSFANTVEQIAQHYLGCLTGTEGYDEWVEGVYDLDDEGKAVTLTSVCSVTVTLDEESGTATTNV
jgi:hypothetical protein